MAALFFQASRSSPRYFLAALNFGQAAFGRQREDL